MLKTFTIVITTLFVAVSVQAQVLTTADTLGKDKQAIMVSGNHVDDAGLGINIAYAMYVRGLTDHLDLYVALGQTRLLGEAQLWASVGGNWRVVHMKQTSVSLFATAAVPATRAKEASTVLVNPAIVISQTLSSKFSVYTGVNGLVPVGAVKRAFFTPIESRFNVPVGTALIVGDYALFAEADLGKLKAIGVGLSKTF